MKKCDSLFWGSIQLSLCAFILMALIGFSKWMLMDILTPFLAPIIILVIWGLALIIIITGLILGFIFFIRTIKESISISLIPLGICFLVIWSSLSIPYTKLIVHYDFKMNLNSRMEIVEKIQNGSFHRESLGGGEISLVTLPLSSWYLSKGGGQVLYSLHEGKTSIFFYTFRGILDNYSGFIYKSDGQAPMPEDFGSEFIEIIKLKENWFWAVSK